MLYYDKSGIKLHLGDSFKILQSFPDESFDAIITDPPYGIGYYSNRTYIRIKERAKRKPTARGKINIQFAGDQVVSTGWIAEAARVLKTGGAAYIFSRFDVLPQWSSAVADHLMIKNVICWVKNKHGTGDLRGAYGGRHEMIIFATKGRHIPYWPKRETDIWTDYSNEVRVHPTQKPLAVMQHAVINACPPGGRILDPFAGSGSTLLAARSLGCEGVGIEIDERWAKAAVARFQS